MTKDARPDAPEPLPVRWLAVAVAVVGALALLGVLVAWPRGAAPDLGAQPTTYVDAEVTGVEAGTCPEIEVEALGDCRVVSVRLGSGDRSGTAASFQVLSTQFEVPELAEGDDVVLLDVATSPPEFRYSFVDFQRRGPLVALVLAFVVVVVAFGRMQGLRALAGLVASGVVLVSFVVPALLRDENALLVALSGTVVIAFVALYLAHGVNRATTVALAGTLVSLAVTTALAFVVAGAAHLTGLADSNAQVLRVTAGALDLRGLLVAGIVVGALGVLDDVTVSQVSTVAALRRADPAMPVRRLYAEAIRVGRDHVASTVNTLVLAYAGASLPLLLFFAQGDRPLGRLVTSEVIAVEVVRMLVGSIGLVLAVPVTTALAAAALRPGDDAHAGHVHGPGAHEPDRDGRPHDRPHDPGRPAGPHPAPPTAPAGWGAFAPEERRF